MYYYSKRSSRKIIHTEVCCYVKSFDPETIGSFENLSTAFTKGYRLCRHCNPIAKQYRQEENAIIDYCYRNGMGFYYKDQNFKITSTISKWIIMTTPSGKTELYHRNTKELKGDAESAIPGYHNQKVSRDSLMEYLEYIRNHDHYRNTHPEQIIVKHSEKASPRKGTKRWRSEQRKLKSRERRQSIRNVLDIIDSLDSSRSACAAS